MDRQLSDWLQSYMNYTAYNEAPDMFHFWTGVGTIAGALRRKVFIDQEYFAWYPNFYIVFVGPPGVATKSTTMNSGQKILREIGGIQFGPNSITWQALIEALEKAGEAVQDPRTGDFTPMSCLTFYSSEIGTLIEPKDRRMMDILVDLWDGHTGAWEKVTRHMGSNKVQNPWLNIIACTTPAWFADNLPRHMIGGGFTSRCMFIYGDKKRNLVAYPKEMIRRYGGEIRQIKKSLIRDLEIISMLQGEFQLPQETLDFGTSWYEQQYFHPSKLLSSNPQFSGYLQRKQGHVHKLAMVLSASRSNDLIITPDDLKKAITLVEATELDMPHIFEAINSSINMENAQMIVSYVTKNGPMPKSDLFKLFFKTLSWKEFTEVIDSGKAAGFIVEVATQRGTVISPVVETPSDTGDKSDTAQLASGARPLLNFVPSTSATEIVSTPKDE